MYNIIICDAYWDEISDVSAKLFARSVSKWNGVLTTGILKYSVFTYHITLIGTLFLLQESVTMPCKYQKRIEQLYTYYRTEIKV